VYIEILFKTPFQSTLLADNRWVLLRKIIPWHTFASSYMDKGIEKICRPKKYSKG